MKYNCIPCNYLTNDASHHKRHIKTKKHIHNVEPCDKIKDVLSMLLTASDKVDIVASKNSEKQRKKSYICDDCRVTFTRSHSLSKHITSCVKRIENNKAIDLERKLREKDHKLIEKEKILKEKERQLKQSEKQVQKLEKDKDYYRGLIDNLSTLGPKNFNSVTYILNNYTKAPHIKTIEPKKLKEFRELNSTQIENIISNYRNNLLVDHVVEAIVYIHKKEDPKDQCIWATDSSRYNYIIKELLENQDSYWTIDKKGTKSEKYLIDPILKLIREKVLEYLTNAGNLLDDNNLLPQRKSIILDSQKDGSDLIKDIDDGLINKEAIKKLAKHIHHNTNPQIEEIE